MALVVKSEVAKTVRKGGLRISAEAYDALDKKVAAVIADAAKRAKENGRKTLMACDC